MRHRLRVVVTSVRQTARISRPDDDPVPPGLVLNLDEAFRVLEALEDARPRCRMSTERTDICTQLGPWHVARMTERACITLQPRLRPRRGGMP